MSRTYTVTGINLKTCPLGEADRVLTVLSLERGLLRVVAPAARKQRAKLGGRSSLFVVNELLLCQGKSLDRILQAESVESFPGLGRDLAKLTAGQYLAEVVLAQALDDHPQPELFALVCEHLGRIERSPSSQTLAHLTQALFHLLALGGVVPQVYSCSRTQQPIQPQWSNPHWRVGFSSGSGGLVSLGETEGHAQGWGSGVPVAHASQRLVLLNGLEVALLQQLAQPQLPDWALQSAWTQDQFVFALPAPLALLQAIARQRQQSPWQMLEKVLRQYIQHHFDRVIRSATLIDSL